MGKGDKKTKRGKIIIGSYGKKRPKKKNTFKVEAKPTQKTKPAIKAEKAAPKPKEVETKPKATAKAETKPKTTKKAEPKEKKETAKKDKE